ncbi:MAG TPA: ABC transporter substrate-binding protein [Burkholderiales bacterium]|nr:ABC transporter substrate-binding protein [Burkholderiales bacterium]
MITRRTFVGATAAAFALGPAAAFGQQKIRRIGYLANDPDEASPTFQAFSAALRELGWVRGKNLEILYLSSRGNDTGFPPLAAEVVRANVDLIVTTGSPSTRAAKGATSTIPIIFGSAANPVEQGFVASLPSPGGNVTGLALLVRELGPKRWELLKELLPHATRFARLYDASSIASVQPDIIREDDAAAKRLGVSLRHMPVAHREGIEPTIDAAARSGVQGIHVTAAAVFVVNRKNIAKLGLEKKMPVIGPDARFPEDGCLASYGENYVSRYRRAAFLADKVLRGMKPADIPVEQSEILEFVINLSTAKKLGVQLPPSVVARADRVVK